MRQFSVMMTTNRQMGRTIVEVMISLTIGLVIVAALAAMFLANRQTFRSTDDKGRLDAEGHLTLSLLAFQVRMAGYGSLLSTTESYVNETNDGVTTANVSLPALYTNNSNENGVAVNAIRGCAGGFSNSSADVGSISCAAGTASDAFLVRYVVDANTANVTAAGVPTDCLGAALMLNPAIPGSGRKAPSGPYFLVENRYFVRMNNGVPELYCQGNGGTVAGTAFVNAAQPIAENVEQMKITYGVSSKNSQVADTFLPAQSVVNWEAVISARICLLMRSTNDGITQSRQVYRDCNNTEVTATDKRLRNTFISTVSIRSRAVGAT